MAYQFHEGDDCGVCTSVYVPFLKRDLEIEIFPDAESSPPSKHQISVLDEILAFDDSFLIALENAAEIYRSYMNYSVSYLPTVDHINRENIREHYSIWGIRIVHGQQPPSRLFTIFSGCDWEDEHGMEWVVKDGEVIFCGSNDFRCDGDNDNLREYAKQFARLRAKYPNWSNGS